MCKNRIKRIFKTKAVLFICSFLSFLIIIVTLQKNFVIREMEPFTWEEILHYSPLLIIGSLGFAAWMTWVGFGDD
jgi:hypothetical protein